MILKSLVIFSWVVASYALLVFWAASWWTAIPLALSLGLAMAGVGFSVMHDGGHGSYSERPAINRWAALSLDLLGGSSFMWNYKHNVLHHTFTNIEGADDDIEFAPFLRLSAGQTRRWYHRFQFLYGPLLLVFLAPKWILIDDFVAAGRGSLGGHPLPRLAASDWFVLFAGKLLFAVWAVLIPLQFVDPVSYLIGAAVVFGMEGFVLGLVFQLAHAVEGAAFFDPGANEHAPLPWAEHQLATTVDFAPRSRLLTWFVGGLNFQVEHHLFPRTSHRHYPALAGIVGEVCARHGVQRQVQPTFLAGVVAHLRHLYRLGLPSPKPSPAPQPVG